MLVILHVWLLFFVNLVILVIPSLHPTCSYSRGKILF